MANSDLATFIGQRLLALREQAGLSQDRVAAAAREVGLSWVQTTVLHIEKGRRQLALEEFVLLPLVYGRCGVALTLPALFVGAEARLAFTEETTVSTLAIDLLLQGQSPQANDIEAPFSEDARAAVRRRSAELVAYRDRLWPRGRLADVDRALRAASGDAELKMARVLGVPAEDLSVVAFKRWQHSLTAEREDRLTGRLPTGATMRTAQAVRGFITRELRAELTTDLEGGD